MGKQNEPAIVGEVRAHFPLCSAIEAEEEVKQGGLYARGVHIGGALGGRGGVLRVRYANEPFHAARKRPEVCKQVVIASSPIQDQKVHGGCPAQPPGPQAGRAHRNVHVERPSQGLQQGVQGGAGVRRCASPSGSGSPSGVSVVA